MREDAPRPPVVSWFLAYAGAMAALYLLAAAAGVAFLVIPADVLEMRPREKIINGAVMAVTCLPLAALFLVALFLPPRPAAWIFDLVLIAIGMTSCCCLPATIPLLIYWLKPEAKRYFGRMD